MDDWTNAAIFAEREFGRLDVLVDSDKGCGPRSAKTWHGKDHVVAGLFKNKVQALARHALPDRVVAKMHGKQAEPGSGRK